MAVRTAIPGKGSGGMYQREFNGERLASGIYHSMERDIGEQGRLDGHLERTDGTWKSAGTVQGRNVHRAYQGYHTTERNRSCIGRKDVGAYHSGGYGGIEFFLSGRNRTWDYERRIKYRKGNPLKNYFFSSGGFFSLSLERCSIIKSSFSRTASKDEVSSVEESFALMVFLISLTSFTREVKLGLSS